MDNLEQPCKGSWIYSARNIKYDGNIVDCELCANNRQWIPNRLLFFPQFEYNNINGKFEWDNCTNGVIVNNYSHEHISKRYKAISIQRCLDNLTTDYDDWFAIQNKYINCVKDKCISISLFRKNVDNNFNEQYNVCFDTWNNKYYKSLIKNLDEYQMNDICVNLYLGNNLSDYIPELSKYKFLNIYLMKSESIGAQPGMLWRFMDITNKSYNTVFIADIDEHWNWVKIWDVNNNAKLSTCKPSDVIICTNPISPAYNFATIIGSHVMVKPNKFDYDIVDVMKGFISLCAKREKSINPYCFDDNEPITLWNYPIEKHEFGWGRKITVYGFDELFLKHVVYHNVYPSVRFI